MKNDLVILVPTYGRPEKALEFAVNFENTKESSQTKLVMVYDQEDHYLPEYLSLGLEHYISPTRGMVPALNYGAKQTLDYRQPFGIGFMGDDHFPRTSGWDVAYTDALWEMSTGMVYGNDLLQGGNLPTQIAMTANIPRRLQFFAYPRFKHLWVDNSWLALGKAIDRIKYLPDVIIEHMHPGAGKVENDENYTRVNASSIIDHDTRVYHNDFLHHLPQFTEELLELL